MQTSQSLWTFTREGLLENPDGDEQAVDKFGVPDGI